MASQEGLSSVEYILKHYTQLIWLQIQKLTNTKILLQATSTAADDVKT
jgi:hypothetical protein